MNKLGKDQKDKVYQFIDITQSSEKDAIQSLKNSNWNVERAANSFYSQPQPSQSSSKVKSRDMEDVFRKYRSDQNPDMIMADGISQLCTDLQVDPSDVVLLVLSWRMNAATMCEFSKTEFLAGLQYLKVDSVQKLIGRLPHMRSELKDENKFKEVYEFAFGWAKEKGQKSLGLETAIGMWQLLFAAGKQWPLVDHWCQFLEKQHDKGISKDTWMQLYDFATKVDSELTNYDATSAWASLIDDFADYLIDNGIIHKDCVGSRIQPPAS